MRCILLAHARSGGIFLLSLVLTACMNGPAIDLAPDYRPKQFLLPDSWRGTSPFALADPADGELRQDWWKLYDDPVLNRLEQQAMAANPDLQAAAERFIQARDEMMKSRSRLIPQVGLGFDASDNRQSEESLFRGLGEPNRETSVVGTGLAAWEPDFWSAIRNATRVEIHRAQQRAADYALARLSLQAEIAADYFTLRGLDAQLSIYDKSIAYYKRLLDTVRNRFIGGIAPEIDVTRTQFLLFDTEAKALEVQRQRQVVEHAIAILVNRAPASFGIEPIDEFPELAFKLPVKIPSTLLERRPDIAAMERRMAQANRTIGIARTAFYPHVFFHLDGGFEDNGFHLFELAKGFWAYGLDVSLPIFQGGFRRAQLQQAWSAYRETVDEYRSTVLNAFREVENALSRTKLLASQVTKLQAAVEAARKTQDMTMQLYTGGLSSSLDLLFAQIKTLEARIDAVKARTELAQASVELIRALGGGWSRDQLPPDDQIQPMGVFQYTGLDKPPPAGRIDVPEGGDGVYGRAYDDLTKPVFTGEDATKTTQAIRPWLDSD